MTLSGLPIFDGGIRNHGFGQYDYIVPLAQEKFLIIRGGEPGDYSLVNNSLLINLVRTITKQ